MPGFYIPGTSREKQKAPRRVLKEACLLRKNVRTNKKHTQDRMCIKQYKPYVQHTAGDTSDIR